MTGFVGKVTEGLEIGKPLSVLVHAAHPMSSHDSFLASVNMTNVGAEFTKKNLMPRFGERSGTPCRLP